MTNHSGFLGAPVLGLLAVIGCSHSESFPNGRPVEVGPRTTVPPIQLTYDLGYDLYPVWLTDGSEVAYTWSSIADSGNRCLAVIPGEGGSRHSQKCWPKSRLADSVAGLNWVAPRSDGEAAWVDQVGKRSHRPPDRSALRVGMLQSADSGVPVLSFPYLAPSGMLHNTGIFLTWLGPDSLAYIGTRLDWGRFDTTATPLEVAILDLTTAPAAVTIVPNTSGATSLSASPDGRTIYYTLANDTRVLAQTLTTGEVTTLLDFQGLGTAGSISLGGNFLGAIVGGNLVRVNLTSGVIDQIIPEAGAFIVGRISPSGERAVVQQFDPTGPNLWMYRFP